VQAACSRSPRFVLAILGLVISAYDTYAQFTGRPLAGCPRGQRHVNGTAVITTRIRWSSACLTNGFRTRLAFYFYVAAVRVPRGPAHEALEVHLSAPRLGDRGHGFVMYLIYARASIGDICDVLARRAHRDLSVAVSCITVFNAATGTRPPAD